MHGPERAGGTTRRRPLLRRIGTVVLFLAAALLLAPLVIPPFLDRIYYRGPASDHFDGRRFFNPDRDPVAAPQQLPPRVLLRFLGGAGRAPWPRHVPVTPGYPAAGGVACPLRPRGVAESWRRCVDRVDPGAMYATWVGHSTVLVQAGGLAILTDPVWSERAGVFGLFGPRRVREPGIRFDDLPHIDLVLISHDHYDHMDLATLRRLWRRDRPLVVTSLGNDAILARAGVPARAADWGGSVAVRPGVRVIVERVHHWSTRWGSDRNRALWSGFTVVLPGGNLFYAGDTGWGDGSWPALAARHGPFRLAILPIGAFRPREVMRSSHIGPVQAVAAFRRLGAAAALGVHWGTFRLAGEPADAPPRLLARALARDGIVPGRFRTTEVGVNWQIPPLG